MSGTSYPKQAGWVLPADHSLAMALWDIRSGVFPSPGLSFEPLTFCLPMKGLLPHTAVTLFSHFRRAPKWLLSFCLPLGWLLVVGMLFFP